MTYGIISKFIIKLMDIGQRTLQEYKIIIESSSTLIWIGPIGNTEFKIGSVVNIHNVLQNNRCSPGSLFIYSLLFPDNFSSIISASVQGNRRNAGFGDRNYPKGDIHCNIWQSTRVVCRERENNGSTGGRVILIPLFHHSLPALSSRYQLENLLFRYYFASQNLSLFRVFFFSH